MNKKTTILLTTIIIALILITIGGIFFDIHNNLPYQHNEPIYWPLAIGFSSAGGVLIVRLILRSILPNDIYMNMRAISEYN
jgi:hypothetical protein